MYLRRNVSFAFGITRLKTVHPNQNMISCRYIHKNKKPIHNNQYSDGNSTPGSNVPTDNFIQSTTDSIYVSNDLDPHVNYNDFALDAKNIFKLSGRYIQPNEFNFKLPNGGVPEFAFVGRSNVGKSSLISALLNEDKLVHVSKTPGCTRSVNYYTLFKSNNNHICYFVDLPGYGYARASKTDQAKWKEIIQNYLTSRDFTVLRRVYVMIDSRHGIRPTDLTMLKLLTEARLSHQIIVTKSDVCTKAELRKTLNSIFKVIMSSNLYMLCLPVIHVINNKDTKDANNPSNGLVPLKYAMAEIIQQPWKNPNDNETSGFQNPVVPKIID